MDIAELQERLEECIDAQKKNNETYLKHALELHSKLNEYIEMNGMDSETEKKIEDTLQIVEMYENFDKKITICIENLKTEIDKKII